MSTVKSVASWTVATIVGVVLVIILAIVAWQVGWFVHAKNVNRGAKIDQASYGRQNALVVEIDNDIHDAQIPGIDPGQRKAIVNRICDDAGRLTGAVPLSLSSRQFIQQECTQP